MSILPERRSTHAPNASFIVDDMRLGSGFNVVTGQTMPSALASTSPTQHIIDHHSVASTLKPILDITELMDPDTERFSSSISLPTITAKPGEIRVGAKRELTFNGVGQTHKSIMFIFLHWERHDRYDSVDAPTLSAVASEDLVKGQTAFWEKYGHVFVSKITYVKRFIAIWRCTAEDDSQIRSFHQWLSRQASFHNIESGDFSDQKLGRAAQLHNIKLNLHYSVVGLVDQGIFHNTNGVDTFLRFRTEAESVRYVVELVDYVQVDARISATAFKEERLISKIMEVFPLVHSTLFFSILLFGAESTQSRNIQSLCSRLRAYRTNYPQDVQQFEDAFEQLKNMYDATLRQVEQQALITEIRCLTYNDFIRSFVVTEDMQGAWVEGLDEYSIGRTDLDDDVKRAEYGVEKKLVDEIQVDAQNHTLHFPGNAKPGGYVVGLIVECSGQPSVPAKMRIGRDLMLGQTTAQIEVTGDGIVWKLYAFFIPENIPSS